MNDKKVPEYEGPAIVELMGHVKLGGMVREATIAGAGFLRIDIPGQCVPVQGNVLACPDCGLKCDCPDFDDKSDNRVCPLHGPDVAHGKTYATQYLSPGSLYRLTPCSEEAMRVIAARNRPEPVTRWELPERPALTGPGAAQEDGLPYSNGRRDDDDDGNDWR